MLFFFATYLFDLFFSPENGSGRFFRNIAKTKLRLAIAKALKNCNSTK
jgi:hypothetical protein